MKVVAIFFVCIAMAMAAPENLNRLPALDRTEVHDQVGQFALRYRTIDGTDVSEQGALKPTNDGKGLVLVKEGEYIFTAPDGRVFRTTYVADQYGFKATGDHLPKSP